MPSRRAIVRPVLRSVVAALAVFLIIGAVVPLLHGTLADGVVRFYYFSDPFCEVCVVVHREVLDPLMAEYGDRIAIEERDISDPESFELLLAFERRFSVTSGSIPEIVIGDDVLVGEDDIRARLRERIEHYLAIGGVALPDPDVPATEPLGDCDECDDIRAAAREAIATRRASEAQGETGVVHAVLFWSETCPACHWVKEQVLPPILEEYGPGLRLTMVEVTGGQNHDLWLAAIRAAGGSETELYVPMLIIGDNVLIGQDIADQLTTLVDRYLEGGGLALPEIQGHSLAGMPVWGEEHPPTDAPVMDVERPPGGPQPIYAAYFYQPGCPDCDRAERDLAYIADKYPQLIVERFNVREEMALNQYLCNRYGVPEEKHLTAPILFLGASYLLDHQIRVPTIEVLVDAYLDSGAPPPWEGWESHADSAAQTIIERFGSFTVLTVLGAGLLDGVNPCAFATMIFLLSYLTFYKRAGRELLATGAAFTVGVFLTYLGVGFGFLRFLDSLPFLHTIGKWVYGATALLCIALAWGSIADYRKAREGRLEDMSLKLPPRLRELSKSLIREGTGARRFVLSSFVLGIALSIVELACTGQVYLPTIIFVLGTPGLRTQATAALLGYNIMFILPLVGVFLLAYFGTTSEQLIHWMNRRAAPVKLGMAALFLVLAGWLVYSIVAF